MGGGVGGKIRGGDGDGGGGRVHCSRCLRVKAAFTGSVKFSANKACATKAAIMAALVVVVGVLVVSHQCMVRGWQGKRREEK